MLLFLVTPCLVLAVQSCVERIPIKKKSFTQTFVKLSSIQTFSCGLTLKPGKMFRLRIVWSVFPLKMNMGEAFVHLLWLTMQPSNVSFHSAKNEPHTLFHLSLLFWWDYVKKRWCIIHVTDKWKGILSNSRKSWSICAKFDQNTF